MLAWLVELEEILVLNSYRKMNIQVNIFFKNIGPGEYTPNHEQIKKRSACSIFGSNIRLTNIVPSE